MKKPPSDLLEKLKQPSPDPSTTRTMEPLATAIPHASLLGELAQCEILVDTTPDKPNRGYIVYRATGKDIPQTLLEIGRLREETFRTVGEGIGSPRDNDLFDEEYDHFICWDKKPSEITGAYRIGRVDLLLKSHGIKGIYTNTFFNLEKMLRADFSEGTLEAGRSFVRPEYQRGLTLMVIWMALARFIAQNPHYKYLMGPVSISNDFQENSKHLMVDYLMKNHRHEKSVHVSSKNPPKFSSNLTPEEITEVVDQSINLNSLQEFVRHAEDNPKAQIPQLIKLYLELGVQFLAFNKDDEFNSVDGLIWLDIRKIPEAIITRYMGVEGWAKYKSYHQLIDARG